MAINHGIVCPFRNGDCDDECALYSPPDCAFMIIAKALEELNEK